MVILHAFLALLAGFAAMTALLLGMTAVLNRLAPSWSESEDKPLPAQDHGYPPGWSLGYVIVNLGYSFLAGAAGGYVTAWAAPVNPLIHTLALGIVVLALAAMSALQSKGKRPVWYLLGLVAISPIGVLAGGLMRLRVLGIL